MYIISELGKHSFSCLEAWEDSRTGSLKLFTSSKSSRRKRRGGRGVCASCKHTEAEAGV